MRFSALFSTRRALFFSFLVLFAGILAWAASIPANVTVTFDTSSFTDGTDYGSNVFASGDFTFTLSDRDWIEGGFPNCYNNTNGCLNATGFQVETITIQTTSGNTFNFASFWDANECGGGFAQVAQAQGYLNGNPCGHADHGFRY